MRLWLGDEYGDRPAAPPATGAVGPRVPAGPDDLAPHYDLTLSLPAADDVAFAAFVRYLAEAADAHGLTCAVLHDGTVHEAVRHLADGRLTVGFHLAYFARWHRSDDPYARLAQAVADAGGRPVNPPARSRLFTDRAAAHAELVRRGLGVVRALTCPRLESSDLVDRPAYWRVLYCLGDLIPFWWRPQGEASGPSYRLLTREEIRCHRLRPVLAYAAALARLSRLEWFSTELCLTDGPEPSRYRVPAPPCIPPCAGGGVRGGWAVLAVDGVNDQCDVDVRSRGPGGMPDAVVRHVAGRFAEAAWLVRHTGARFWAAEPRRRAA